MSLTSILSKSSSTSSSSTSSGTYDDSDFSKDSILGLPFRYNTYADPRRRVYNSSFITDAAIVTMIPGKPLFRSASDDDDGLFSSLISGLFGDSDNDESILENISNQLLGGGDDDETILSWLKSNQHSNEQNGDLRYYRFCDDYDTFMKYLDVNIATLSAKMGVSNLTNAKYSTYMDRSTNSSSLLGISKAFKFYTTKSGSSVSESISNDFGDSQLASTMNSVSETVQELRYLLGTTNDTTYTSGAADKLSTSIGNTLNSLIDTLVTNDGDSGSDLTLDGTGVQLGNSITTALGGNKLIWPQIWKNSTFSRNYNLSFEFVSPYGSPESIFRFVYLPFLVLMTMACPKQYGLAGYTNPFLIRCEMPGYFTSDLAVIQSMSWRKGGNDSLFTADGLPLAITVDIQIQDLYPTMMMALDWKQLRANTGMHSFLDNMAGLSVERFTPWQNWKSSLTARVSGIAGDIKRASPINQVRNKLYNVSVNNALFGNALS
jgi:hypothetical protein